MLKEYFYASPDGAPGHKRFYLADDIDLLLTPATLQIAELREKLDEVHIHVMSHDRTIERIEECFKVIEGTE